MRIGSKRRVIVAVSGYARAGKDTFADYLLERVPTTVMAARMKFAGALKRATHAAFKELGLDADPWTEEPVEKSKLRPVFVSLGEYARSRNPDVFAGRAAREIERMFTAGEAELVVLTDMRYINEHTTLTELSHRLGYEYYWVHVVRIGHQPANAVEAVSVRDLSKRFQPDWECYANDKELHMVELMAKDFVRTVLPHEWFTTSTSK